MARRESGRDGPRGDRWTERLDQWHQGQNAKYQAEGWEPDIERDSSLGEYYPADEFYEYPDASFQGTDYTGGGQPRSMADNRESGYQQGYGRQPPNRARPTGEREPPQRGRNAQYTGRRGGPTQSTGPDDQGLFYDPGYGAGDWHGQTAERPHPYRTEPDYTRPHNRGPAAYRDWTASDFTASGATNYRGKGPKGYQRADHRIREDICERLTEDPYVDASEISVEVTEGKVTLQGLVYNRVMKHRAEDIVADCTGVKDIDNRLRLMGQAGQSNQIQNSAEIRQGAGDQAGAGGESGGAAEDSSGVSH